MNIDEESEIWKCVMLIYMYKYFLFFFVIENFFTCFLKCYCVHIHFVLLHLIIIVVSHCAILYVYTLLKTYTVGDQGGQIQGWKVLLNFFAKFVGSEQIIPWNTPSSFSKFWICLCFNEHHLYFMVYMYLCQSTHSFLDRLYNNIR